MFLSHLIWVPLRCTALNHIHVMDDTVWVMGKYDYDCESDYAGCAAMSHLAMALECPDYSRDNGFSFVCGVLKSWSMKIEQSR